MSSSTQLSCTVPVTKIRDTPYNLEWGSSVFAKVRAINTYGESELSDEGNGAVISTYPDPPVSLVEDTVQRTKSTLAIAW